MKKLTLVCILVLVLIITGFEFLYASETRTFSMGNIGPYIHDDSNVMPFPGTLMYYNNQIITELRTFKGQPDQYYGGVHLPLLNTDYIVGVYLNRPLIMTIPVSVGQGMVELDRTTDLLFGMKRGNNNLGFRLSYAADSYKDDSIELEESARYIELAGGLSTELYDAGLSIHLPSISSELVGIKDEWSGFGILANGRYFYEINETMTLVPLVTFGTFSSTQDDDTLENTFGASRLILGASVNYQIDEQTLLILGLEAYKYESYSEDYEGLGKTTTSSSTIPAIFIGAESGLNSWLTGRCGIRQEFQSTTTKNEPDGAPSTETSSSDSDIDFMFGFGLQFGSLVMDVDLNQSLFFDGPNFVSGQSNQIFNRISITYIF